MELIKRNIHMDRLKCEASTQIVLEDDINISDAREDASSLIMDKGNVVLEEVKVTDDHVKVKGYLEVCVLYTVDGKETDMACMEGKIPFEEQIYTENVKSTDQVEVNWEIEDLTVGLIHSRKLGVQAILTLKVSCEEICDEETVVDLRGGELLEFRKKPLQVATLSMKKKDIFRLKQEVEIPGSFPNIMSLVFWDIVPTGTEVKLAGDKINLQGELNAFFLYRGEGEEEELCHYETVIPFSGNMECAGAKESMIPEINCRTEVKGVDVRPDFDGEDRVFSFEVCVGLSISAYEEEETEILSDVYSVEKEAELSEREATFRKFVSKGSGKMKLAQRLTLPEPETIGKILHTAYHPVLTGQELCEEGLVIQGYLQMKTLYLRDGERGGYGMLKKDLPFRYVLECAYQENLRHYPVCGEVEQMAVTVLDGREIDVKCILYFRANLYTVRTEKIVEQIQLKDADAEKMASLPGMVIYMVREGESLWDIGKRYYVPVSELKKCNELTSDEIKCGDRILIVKNN